MKTHNPQGMEGPCGLTNVGTFYAPPFWWTVSNASMSFSLERGHGRLDFEGIRTV
jgi:hypothetical protein